MPRSGTTLVEQILSSHPEVYGAGELLYLENSINKNFLEKANIFYRVNRLIDNKQMGELFKVIYLYKNNQKFELGFK